MSNPQYVVKVIYTGDEEMLVGEPLITFYKDKEQVQPNKPNNPHAYFVIPYELPTFFPTKRGAIVAAFQLQAILDNMRLQYDIPNDQLDRMEFFCKAWTFDLDQYTNIRKENDSLKEKDNRAIRRAHYEFRKKIHHEF